MTAPALLAYISAALLIQLVVGTGIALWRRRERIRTPINLNLNGSNALAGAWSGWRDFRVARREFEDRAHMHCSFYLEPVDGVPVPTFKPGQYLTFSLPVPADRSTIRCYSLSDKPDPSGYRITVKRIVPSASRPDLPPGASSNYLHDCVHEGDILKARAPSGRFCIDGDPSLPVVFIAGGIGITPLICMLRWCLTEQPTRTIHLFYALRHGGEHAFRNSLDDLARAHPCFQLYVIYSRPGDSDALGRDYHYAGHVDLGLVRNCLPHGRHQFYICGPPPMMQSLVPALREWGVQESDLHFEAFGPASVGAAGPSSIEPLPATAASIEVRFQKSGRTLVWDGRDSNLLDFAERHNVVVESGCRSGSCGTCETKLVSGTVSYAGKPDHEIAEDHCLLCVGKPQSPLVVDA
jgi:ferredoxin-NADP reductase